MFCPQCGAQVEEGSSFCGECGARLQPDDAARPAAGATDAAQPRRKGHIKAIVACAIAALLLAGAGIGVWFVTRPPLQAIDEEAFPDAGVRAAVSAQLDTDGDGKLSEEEMEGAVELTIDEAEEVAGLGAYLPNLADITVGGPAVSVDTSDLAALERLDLTGATQLTGIDTHGCPKLTQIGMPAGAPLASLDVSGCESLTGLTVPEGSSLTSLDASGCTGLTEIAVPEEVPLDTVDITGCGSLAQIDIPPATELVGAEDSGIVELWLPELYSVMMNDWYTTSAIVIERDERGYVQGFDQWSGDTLRASYAFEHDGGGLVSAYTVQHGDSGVSIRNELSWDDGRLLEVTSSSDGSLSSELALSYDDAGGLAETMERYPDSSMNDTTVAYDYTEDGQLASVDTQAPGMNPAHERAEWTYENGVAVQGVYVSEGRTTGTTTHQELAYEYDDAGRIVRVSCPVMTSPAYGDDRNHAGYYFDITYTYDDEGRLAGAACDAIGVSATVSYDDEYHLMEVVETYPDGTQLIGTVSYRRYFCARDAVAQPEELVRVMPSYTCLGESDADMASYAAEPQLVTCYVTLPDAPVQDPFHGSGQSMLY